MSILLETSPQIFTERCVTEHRNLNMLGPNRIEEPELSNLSITDRRLNLKS